MRCRRRRHANTPQSTERRRPAQLTAAARPARIKFVVISEFDARPCVSACRRCRFTHAAAAAAAWHCCFILLFHCVARFTVVFLEHV